MQAYETSLKTGTRLVLAPDSPFFKYFEQPHRRRAARRRAAARADARP
ncbi:hypothetical protein [Chenggangzhangella methanolivorans]|nr:hypothetical protein [Chenggangzhangella methanolivorans]